MSKLHAASAARLLGYMIVIVGVRSGSAPNLCRVSQLSRKAELSFDIELICVSDSAINEEAQVFTKEIF